MNNTTSSEKHLSEVLNKLIAERKEVERLNRIIKKLDAGEDFYAELNFRFTSNKRSAQRYWLNKEEMLLVLNKYLTIAESTVEGIERIYNETKTANNG